MKGDVSGVRITPNKINFLDTQINTVYTVNITVKNISTISKSIRYYAPQTKVMCLYCLYSLHSKSSDMLADRDNNNLRLILVYYYPLQPASIDSTNKTQT